VKTIEQTGGGKKEPRYKKINAWGKKVKKNITTKPGGGGLGGRRKREKKKKKKGVRNDLAKKGPGAIRIRSGGCKMTCTLPREEMSEGKQATKKGFNVGVKKKTGQRWDLSWLGVVCWG